MKLFAIVVIAFFAAVASAQPTPDQFEDEQLSQLALIPDDVTEVGKIKPEMAIFNDFCISSRDKVRKYLTESVNTAASRVFHIMFNTINDVASDTIDNNKNAVAEGVELIKNVDINKYDVDMGAELIKESHLAEPSEDDSQPREKIAKDLEKRVQAVRGGLMATISASLRLVFETVLETVSSETAKRLALLRTTFKGENLKDIIRSACDDISYNLKKILVSSLSETKKELMTSSKAAQYKDILYKTKLEDIGCVTIGRVNMVGRFCDIMTAAGPMIYPMLGL